MTLGATVMDKALLWFARIWVTLVIVANLLAVVGLFVGAASFSEWWSRVQKTYSPSNISNVLVELIALSPGLAYYWHDRRQKAKGQRLNSITHARHRRAAEVVLKNGDSVQSGTVKGASRQA